MIAVIKSDIISHLIMAGHYLQNLERQVWYQPYGLIIFYQYQPLGKTDIDEIISRFIQICFYIICIFVFVISKSYLSLHGEKSVDTRAS